MWLAPVQAKILPVTERQLAYAEELKRNFRAKGLRVDVDTRNEGLGAKIKLGRNERVPYLIIVGDKEMAEGNVSVRNRREGELGTMDIEVLTEKMLKEVEEKTV